MRLQKMKYYEVDGTLITVVCAVGINAGCEFTICGNAIPDSNLEHVEAKRVGEEYEGSLKDVTCGCCIANIGFIKNLK